MLSDKTWKIFFRLICGIGGDPRLLHIAQWIRPHSQHGAQKVLSISFSALRSRSSKSFSSPYSRAVSFSTHCSAQAMASARTKPGVMSRSLDVIFLKYRSSRVFRMCAASFSMTQHTAEKSQGHGAELSNNSYFLAATFFVRHHIFQFCEKFLSLVCSPAIPASWKEKTALCEEGTTAVRGYKTFLFCAWQAWTSKQRELFWPYLCKRSNCKNHTPNALTT